MQNPRLCRGIIIVLGLIPPPLNFAKIHARGGRGLQPEQPKDSIPPLGAQQNAAARAAAVPEPGGRGEKAVMCLGGPDAGGLLPGRRGTGAMPGGTAGAFGAEAGGFSPGGGPPTGRGRGLAA